MTDRQILMAIGVIAAVGAIYWLATRQQTPAPVVTGAGSAGGSSAATGGSSTDNTAGLIAALGGAASIAASEIYRATQANSVAHGAQ